MTSRNENWLKSESRVQIWANTVLTHENCRMRVVKQIPGEMRQLPNHLFDHVGMAMSRRKNGQAWRSEQRGYEPPSRRGVPRSPHDSGMGTHAEKLIED
jgi:hypothetical protein